VDRVTGDAVSWAPSREVFLRRVFISAAVTFAGLGLVGTAFGLYTGLSFGWALLVAFALTMGFLVEDVLRWRGARTDLWQISDGQLLHDGPEGRAQVPLSEIIGVQTQFGGRVILKLSSGQRIAIRYLADPQNVAQQIRSACGPRVA
jgi:hypothetical protein